MMNITRTKAPRWRVFRTTNEGLADACTACEAAGYQPWWVLPVGNTLTRFLPACVIGRRRWSLAPIVGRLGRGGRLLGMAALFVGGLAILVTAQGTNPLPAVFIYGNDSAGAVTRPIAVNSSGQPLTAQAGTWTVQPGNTANTTAWKVDGSAVTQPVSGTFWQATQPVSATTLPLPTGASTAAKQPALGTAGTPSTDVISIQGVASGTVVPANLSQVAGTTTVNGGLAGSLAMGGTAATNAAINQNPLLIGAEALSSQPTAATTGNQRRLVTSLDGALFVRYGGPILWSCFMEAVTATTQCLAAPAAGLKAYVVSAILSNKAATANNLDIVFGTGAACATGITALTHKFTTGSNATTTSPFIIQHMFLSPLNPTAANAICVRPSAATAFGATLTGFTAP